MLKQLLKNKGVEVKKLSPAEQKAKLSVVGAMRDMASGMMNDKLKGLKKVTVASNDPEGLQEGLEKAKELLDKKGMEHGEAESQEEGTLADELEESPEEQAKEDAEGTEEHQFSPEEIDAQIKRLLEMKSKLKA